MEKLVITGGVPLLGKVRISGAKNAALTAICASLMAEGEVVLDNVPRIADVEIMLRIINRLGVETCWEGANTLVIKTPVTISKKTIYKDVKMLRASNLLLGPLVARFNEAEISMPGGCNIGIRPMDLHIKGLALLGADISCEHGFIKVKATKLTGNKIYLDFPSVGATENIMMAAALAEGLTIIENVAKEPEIVDLANLLNTLGAKVKGAGTDMIKIEGVPKLVGDRYAIIPDRIEAGTFLIAAVATRGNVTVENVIPTHLEPLMAKLREAGVTLLESDDKITVVTDNEIGPVDLKTLPYPGFPTDMQSQFMSFLTEVKGTSVVVENIFENRLQLAQELRRMGAKIKVEGRSAVVEGVPRLQGAQVKASDLRAGAALVIAGLMAEGNTEISNVQYIDRGYENLEGKLVSLGAKINRSLKAAMV